ncbi:MAG: lamin tail domain-containing protein [Caldilineaceae bacterium]
MLNRTRTLLFFMGGSLCALLSLLLTTVAFSPQVANADSLNRATALVINEVDADTPGSDTAEFVEIYDGGAGNTSLTGYTLVFFNGTNDQSYYALDLDGYSTDANGYFVAGNSGVALAAATFPTDTLQQGADAVALYQADGTNFPNRTPLTTTNLIDALVYDTNDADDTGLLTLLNVGQPQVNEAGSGDAPAHSNQRCPNGSGGQRNSVAYIQAPPSPGAANTCNAVTPSATPTPTATPVTPTPTSSVTPATGIVINEVDVDTPSTDTAEFIELYDGGVGNTALEGLALVFFDGADDESYLAIDLDGFSTDANGYLVVGNKAVASAVITFADGALQNGADAIALYMGSASDFPNNTPVTTTKLLDAIVYGTDDDSDAGLLTLLLAGQQQMNEAGARNADAVAMGRCPNGSGGQRTTAALALVSPSPREPNNCGSPLPTLTPTATSATPSATPMPSATATTTGGTPVGTPVAALINEVDADSPDADTAEFIELMGPAGAALDGLCLVAYNGSNDRAYLVVDLDGKTFNAAGFFVVGNAGVANVGLTFADNALQNGPDAVALYAVPDCSGAFNSNTTVTTANLVDAVVYETNDDDDAELLALLNPGQAQVNEDGGGDSAAHANARCPDGAGGARNSGSFTQVAPSPGSANACGALASTPTPTATATVSLETTPTVTPTPSATPDDRLATVTPTATSAADSNDVYLPVIQR